jgi:aminoglycoside phosphotransferase (APT) family kinase protein
MSFIDQPRAVREEDQLDIAAIQQFLLTSLPQKNLQGELLIKQFLGGASNLTYQLDFDHQAFILRCAPKGTKAKGAHDMAREFQIMERLKPVFPYVPEMYVYTDDTTIIGREFYVMEKLRGIIPRANLPKGLILNETEARQLCTNVLDKLVALHQIDVKKSGLDTFGKGEGYAQRQIEGWCARFEKAKTWNVPSFAYIMDYLRENIPTEERNCFIHNDFRFDNVVLNPDNPLEVIGVLDWELATVGNPLMDLGSALAYWIQADDDMVLRSMRRQPTHLKGMFSRSEVVDYYLDKMNFPKENFTFYEVYGIFRLAVILQQIYYRYYHKQTTNPAFKNFWLMINYLHWRCRKVIRR